MTSHPFTVVFAKATASIPIWVYILATLLGILILAGLIYLMHRFGFFRRKKKEELEKEKRASMAQGTEMQPLASGASNQS